jgi:hypothetical protein
MCPFCLSALGSIVAGSMSTGGLAALAVKISRKKNNTSVLTADPNERSSFDVNQHN